MTTNSNPAEAFSGGFEVEDRLVPDPSATIKAGDMIYWDGSSYTNKVVASDANAATFKGISQDQWPMTVYAGEEESPTIKVRGVGIFNMKTTAGETYHAEEKLYVGADAQTVTKVAGSYPVGVVAHNVDTDAAAGILGAAGVVVPVTIRRRVPADVAIPA